MATGPASKGQSADNAPVPETEILNVVIQREGEKVSTKWGLHPNLKEELKPEEWKELTEIMGKVTTIIGKRFTQVLDQIDQETSGSA